MSAATVVYDPSVYEALTWLCVAAGFFVGWSLLSPLDN